MQKTRDKYEASMSTQKASGHMGRVESAQLFKCC